MELTCGAAVLAAGGGSRFTGPAHKLLTPVGGAPLVRLTVQRAVEAAIGPVAVVTGAVDLTSALAGLSVDEVVNDDWASGLATSLAAAVRWARACGLDALVVGLGDQPGVTADAWRAVAHADRSLAIVAAEYDHRRAHPVRFRREVWDELPVSGDEGARALVGGPSAAGVPCSGSPFDIDTVEDLQEWS